VKLPICFAAAFVLFGGLRTEAQPVRVGTFHSPSIVVAYYRSPMWADVLKAKMADREAAKQANDDKKVQELEAWGKSQQELAHRQLSGEAPITNILAALRPALPQIADQAQVALIAPDLLYIGSSVTTVDITDLILDWLKADERTRKIVRDLRSRPGPMR
jgi:hypothetical protein